MNNNINDISQNTSHPHITDEEIYIELMVLGTICIFGCLFNVLTLVAAIRNKQGRKAYHLLILNLTVTNLLLSSVACPLYMHGIASRGWYIGQGLCYLLSLLITQGLPVSCCTNAAIAFNRFLCCCPHSTTANYLRTKKATLVLIFLVWLFVFIVSIVPQISGEIRIGYNAIFGICAITTDNDLTSIIVYITCIYVILVMIPFVLTCFFYIRVIVVITRKPQSFKSASSLSYNKQACKTTGMMFLVFSVCWLPDTIHNLVDFNSDMIPIWATRGLFLLFLSSSAINPLMYLTSMKEFRFAVVRIHHCGAISAVTRTETQNASNNTTDNANNQPRWRFRFLVH